MSQGIDLRFRTSFMTLSGIALIATVTLALFLQGDSGRSWANYADQELTLAYNAILLQSGMRQESYDHTGFVTMYLLGQYIKLKSLISDDVIINLGQINRPGYFNTFQLLVGYAREFAAISIFAIASIVFVLSRNMGIGHTASLFAAIAFFFSTGVLVHFEQLRTELLSTAFLLLSSSVFSSLAGADKKNNYGKLVIALIVLNIAIVNKMQIYIFAMIYFYGFMLLKHRKSRTDVAGHVPETTLGSCNVYDYGLGVVLFAFYFAAVAIGRMSVMSIFLMSAFFACGGIVWAVGQSPSHAVGMASIRPSRILKFVSAYALSLIASVVLLLILSRNPLIFMHLINPSDLALYVSNHNYSLDWLSKLMEAPFGYLVSLDHTPSVYLTGVAVAAYAAREKLVKFDAWAFIFFVLSYYFVELASSFRYMALHYEIFAETILLLAFLYFLQLIQKNEIRILVALLLLAGTFSITFTDIVNRTRSSAGMEGEYCASSYMKDQHHQINVGAFYRECEMAGFRVPPK